MQDDKELTVGTGTAASPTLKKVETDQLRPQGEVTTAPAPVEATKAVEEEVVEDDNRSPGKRAFDTWVSRHIHNSPLSEHTASYNYLLSQLPELEALIEKEG